MKELGKRINREKILKWLTICLLIYSLLSVYKGCEKGMAQSKDFQWDSAKLLAMRINPYEESLHPTGVLEQYDFGGDYGKLEANQFPSLLWLLLPFTFFAPGMANILWTIFNLICVILFLICLRKTFLNDLSKEEYFFTVAVFLSGTPLRNCLAMGQHTLFSVAFLMLAIYMAQKEKHMAAGLFLSLSYFKYVLIVPMALYFIYKRWFKEIMISVIPHIILTVFSAWWLESSFMDMILQPLAISAKLVDKGEIDLGRWIGNGNLAMLIAVLLGISLMVFVFFVPKGYDKEVITLLTLVTLILMYHRFYDFLVLVVPMALLLFREGSSRFEKAAISVAVCLSYYAVSVIIHLWEIYGTEYNILLAVLAVFYYALIGVELYRMVRIVIKEHSKTD